MSGLTLLEYLVRIVCQLSLTRIAPSATITNSVRA
jgi:hypothetical protein